MSVFRSLHELLLPSEFSDGQDYPGHWSPPVTRVSASVFTDCSGPCVDPFITIDMSSFLFVTLAITLYDSVPYTLLVLFCSVLLPAIYLCFFCCIFIFSLFSRFINDVLATTGCCAVYSSLHRGHLLLHVFQLVTSPR